MGDCDRERLVALVRGARRRVLANRVLRESVFGATIAIWGPIFVLLSGAYGLAWPIVLVFALTGIATSALRVRRRLPAMYDVAQALDARLQTDDQISTAIHFLGSETPAAVLQRQCAARLAGRTQCRSVFPTVWPRSLYSLAATALLGLTLWAFRSSTDAPSTTPERLVKSLLQKWISSEQLVEAALKGEKQEDRFEQRNERSRAEGSAASRNEARDEERVQSMVGQAAAPPDEAAEDRQQTADASSPGSVSENRSPERDPGQAGPDGQQPHDGAPTDAGRDVRNAHQAPEGLLSRLRDRVKEFLSHLQPSRAPSSPSSSPPKESQAADASEAPGEGSEGGSEQQSGQQKAAVSAPAQDGKDAADLQQQERTGGDPTGSNGPGSEEGNKQFELAQQRADMGKLSELYARRSAALTGAVTLEAPAGEQRLATAESDPSASHANPAGVVSRDRIPLAYQAYVKQYFDALRRSRK
jgi:hypothetical protein